MEAYAEKPHGNTESAFTKPIATCFGKSENFGPQSYCMVDLRLYDRQTRAKRIAGKGYGLKHACVMQAYGEKALD
uniref:Uncharacterized protein n=1 Tax=Trichuris muris TaxID=70415 RepID=A0A5S6QKH0_TRIMR